MGVEKLHFLERGGTDIILDQNIDTWLSLTVEFKIIVSRQWGAGGLPDFLTQLWANSGSSLCYCKDREIYSRLCMFCIVEEGMDG